jgi:hypothetical protein
LVPGIFSLAPLQWNEWIGYLDNEDGVGRQRGGDCKKFFVITTSLYIGKL